MTHDLWSNLNRVMVDFLDSVSLRDLVEQQKQRMAQQGINLAQLQDNRRAPRRAPAGDKQPVMS
jgi:Rrf2 family iron-sulfur cluster assembly transcriptional regulator